tara:strand:+ start:584 stop:1138 length:555 start_codon:yes stop_codon:yes gene_type:complete
MNLIDVDSIFLLIIDIQDKLIKKIENKDVLINSAVAAVDIFQHLKLPVLCSEQYPQGLGKTISQIDLLLEKEKVLKISKTSFSCYGSDENVKIINSLKKKQVIIIGIEAHICVLQTAFDLKKNGFEVFVLTDGVGSRSNRDSKLAIKRLSAVGVSLINLEMMIFELIRDSKHDMFKYITQKYVN